MDLNTQVQSELLASNQILKHIKKSRDQLETLD